MINKGVFMIITYIPTFCGRHRANLPVISNNTKIKNQYEDMDLKNVLFNSMILSSDFLDIEAADAMNTLKNAGIKNVGLNNGNIFINTKKGNSFWISPPVKLNDIAANIFVYGEVIKPVTYYGIKPYIDVFDTFRRADIVKKGLRISTSKLDYLSQDDKQYVSKKLSRLINKNVLPKDLFSSSTEIYYPDIKNKTVYGTAITNRKLEEKDISVCKFITDKDDNVIGYERSAYDLVRGKVLTSKYVEQQELDINLPPIVDKRIPYKYALACRFGNYDIPDRYQEGIDNVLSQLRKSRPDIKKEDLQGIKFTQEGVKKDVLIGYYSPVSGRSLIFDKFGKFLYKLEYIKNENGEIIDSMELR